MKAIIFGANGQDGFYLNKLLTEQKIETIGISRNGDWIIGDVADHEFVKKVIAANKPDYIFHLAANSTTSHNVWLENHRTICDGTLFILESVKEFSPHTKVFISGSALQFVNTGKPIKETDTFFADSPYAVSRIHSVYAARYYRSLGLKTYVGYFFNHDSPLRSERHMSKKIASFAQRIAKGEDISLEIGDISVKKEWNFAGDTVNAIWQLVKQDYVEEVVIGNGLGYSIEDWLDACFKLINKDWHPYIKHKAGYVPEYQSMISDPQTLLSLGWNPQVSFTDLAKMMME